MRLVRNAMTAVLLAFASFAAQATELSFDRLERALRLNPVQQQQFDIAVKSTHRAMLAMGLGVLQIKAQLGRELLKDRPDPQALKKAQEDAIEQSRPHLRAARDEWLRLYAMLDDDQVAIARIYVEGALSRIEELGEHLAKRFLEAPQRP